MQINRRAFSLPSTSLKGNRLLRTAPHSTFGLDQCPIHLYLSFRILHSFPSSRLLPWRVLWSKVWTRSALFTLSAKYPALPLSRQHKEGRHSLMRECPIPNQVVSDNMPNHSQLVCFYQAHKRLSLQPRLVFHLPIASPTENGLSNSGNFSTGSITIAIFKPSKAFWQASD